MYANILAMAYPIENVSLTEVYPVLIHLAGLLLTDFIKLW